MNEGPLRPAEVLAASGTDDPVEFVRLGIVAAKSGKYERGLIFLTEAYNRLTQRLEQKEAIGEDTAVSRGAVPANALSYYGLCLALHKGHYKEAARFCELAIAAERDEGGHYLNLARVWQHGGNRKKAVEAIERGLTTSPRYTALQKFRDQVGLRSQPVLSFLTRDDPLNKALGKLRHKLKAKKAAAPPRKKAASTEAQRPR
jgi:tetratricopeptide (TPR) repeat protein